MHKQPAASPPFLSVGMTISLKSITLPAGLPVAAQPVPVPRLYFHMYLCFSFLFFFQLQIFIVLLTKEAGVKGELGAG